MRWILSVVLVLIHLTGTASSAESEIDASLEPVPCMSLDDERVVELHQNMKDTVLSIQVCIQEENYSDAAGLYFITWPFLMFNEEATRNDRVTQAYVTALEASLQHYFTGMTEQQQDALFNELDTIVEEPAERTRLCERLATSPPPVVEIRQDASSAPPVENTDELWSATLTRYGCDR